MDHSSSDESNSSFPEPATGGQIILLFIAIMAVVYSIYATPPTGLSIEAQQTLGIFCFGLLLWQSKVIPYAISSLLVVGLLFGLDIAASMEEAAIGFSSSLFFFFFTLLILGGMITKTNLDRWVAQRLLSVSHSPKSSLRRLGQYLLALSFFMPSGLARMVAFTPIVETINDSYGIDQTDKFLTPSFLVLGQLNPIASMSLMTGGGLSIIGAGMISAGGYSISWVDWMVYMAPPTILIYVLGFFTVDWLYDVSDEDIGLANENTSSGAESASETVDKDSPGQLTRDQQIIALVMGGTLIAWFSGSIFNVPTILPPIGAIAILSAPRIRILGADDIKSVNWGILFLIGAMLSLVEMLEKTGAFEWIISLISSAVAFDALNPWLVVIALLLFVVLFRLLFPNGSTCLIVVLPIIIQFGQTYNVHVVSLALSAILIVGSMVLVPLHIPPALLAFNRGHVESKDVLITGLCTLFFALVTITLSWVFYWPLVM